MKKIKWSFHLILDIHLNPRALLFWWKLELREMEQFVAQRP